MGNDDLVEWGVVPDVYADGLATAEPLTGDNIRATYFVYQRATPSAALVRVVCARIIRPRSSLIGHGTITNMLKEWPTVPKRLLG